MNISENGDGMEFGGPTSFTLGIEETFNYAESTLKSLNELRLSETLADVRLVAEFGEEEGMVGEEIPANRCVLASRSDYFKAMFTIGMCETTQQAIVIHGVSHWILTKVVEFIYTGTCSEVTKMDVLELTRVSAMMQITSLHQACKEFLRENIDTATIFNIWSVADSYQFTDILRSCAQLIPNYLGVLLERDEFSSLPASMVHTVLKFQKVNLGPVHDHYPLREALQRWVNFNRDNSEQMRRLESYVDLEKLDITSPSTLAASTSLLSTPAKITSLPTCFSLISVVGGLMESDTRGQCEITNFVDVLDTQNLSWQSSPLRSETRKIIDRTVFASEGMLYFLTRDMFNNDELYQFEPVLCKWKAIREVRRDEAIWQLAESNNMVRATSENGHEVYFCGSMKMKPSESGQEAFKIDAKKNIRESLPRLPHPRYHHGAAVVNGDLFVVGGSTVSWKPLKSVLILRKGQRHWGEGFPMSEPRIGPAVAVMDGYIYCAGGTNTKQLRTTERYHISSNRWETLEAMKSPRAFAGAAVAGSCLFVFGGKSCEGKLKDSGKRNALNACEMYNPASQEWVELPPMEKFRCEMLTLTI